MALIEDANTGQVISLQNVTGSAIGLGLFTVVLDGTGGVANEGVLRVTPTSDLTNNDTGLYDFVATIEDDGGASVDVHIRVIVVAGDDDGGGGGGGGGDDDGCSSNTGGGSAWLVLALLSALGVAALRRRMA